MPRKGKCFSTCRKRPKSDCSTPECHYTNGNKYKYCRLAFTRKMDPPDCVPELKIPVAKNKRKTEKSRSPDSIAYNPDDHPENSLSLKPYYPLDLRPSASDLEAFRAKYARKVATRKIAKFLRRTNPRIRSKFLKSVCSDSGVCIAFGKESAAIKRHFANFANFRLLSEPAKGIGVVSANGFVKELTYMNQGYVANAVLKSSADRNSDNLLYEALVGFFVNKLALRFPTFVETYGLYRYKNDGLAYRECKTNKIVSANVLEAGLTKYAGDSKDIENPQVFQSCFDPVSMAVLIQHLKSAKTLKEMCGGNPKFVRNDLLYVLFQIYMTLAHTSNIFTHYDLHTSNVLVYEPVAGSHIEYYYHIDGEVITFNSPYIAKIIDYGRSYYRELGNDSMVGNSKNFYEQLLCKECKPKCGASSGFGWLENNKRTIKSSFYIVSQISNPSHDLRLLNSLNVDTIRKQVPKLGDILKKVVYSVGVAKKNRVYGTELNPHSGLPHTINNVMDAFILLQELVQDPISYADNAREYATSSKLGELHIYQKQPMLFIPAP